MGWLSSLAKIGGLVAAPFSGGASLALTGLGSVGDVLGKQQEGKGAGMATQAGIQNQFDRNAIDLYGSQQGAQNSAADLDLKRKSYETQSRSSAGKEALIAMLLGDHKPTSISTPGIQSSTISGGMGDTIKNNPQILELLKSIAAKGTTDQATPMSFTGGNLVAAPKLTPLPKAGKSDGILNTIARIAQIAGGVGSLIKPKAGGNGDYGGEF